MMNGLESMAPAVPGDMSNADNVTDQGKITGVHITKIGKGSMSSAVCAKMGGKASIGTGKSQSGVAPALDDNNSLGPCHQETTAGI